MQTNSALAPYASHAEQTKGRLYNTSDSPTRSEFQRDRDRIIHSNAFRRLKHKTQVFLHHEGNHFRTRLTHTLEVSQIARSIARALHLNEDLAECLALAHDLGHTPFGHAGERVMHAKMQAHGGFDHNVQALRVVTSLENRYAEHDGLNLTWETLEGIIKHNGPLVDGQGRPIGKYVEEGLPFGLDLIASVSDLRLESFASLEAQAAAIADDVAYNAHDIDDALRAGLLSLDQLREVPIVGDIVQEVQQRYPEVSADRQSHETIRRLITRTIEDVIRTAEANIKACDPKNAEDVRLAGKPLICFSDDVGVQEKKLKSFLFAKVYRSETVMAPVKQGEQIVAALFDAFVEGEPMPEEWERLAKSSPIGGRERIVCDFVSGMTDPYATNTFNRLFDADVDFR
ncbi:deoxyguanosinetriphosphate triphosphohydrolase [Maritalea porphyrae]|uniref:Deoxyguanosinetriphosphate triphosphohydrolase-like protein n=1 Tax=Maritalea porphyrae TaxID=880732 RepID=A0ABQ5UV98_9HYPH|nr:deoxyguanosinetriphosphate triphosphohydrolase [Maritalea porphyrae]GLQ18329.1 deoxyguanosinetriphosphate triphosphohydrolase-like protein [Maritalea porphyrae]